MLLFDIFIKSLKAITSIEILGYVFGVLFVICLLGIVTHRL